MLLLPDPRRRGEIQFKVARFLPYGARLALIAAGLAVGIGLQLVLDNPWIGAPLVLGASLLSLVSGYTNVLRDAEGKKEWKPVGRASVQRIVTLHERSRRWDQSLVDITCARGFLFLLAAGGAVAGVAYFMRDQRTLQATWIADAVLVLVPQWVTGVRRILTRPGLIVKVGALTGLAGAFERLGAKGESLQWMLEVRETPAGTIPDDLKLMVKYAEAPEGFLGVQVQVSLNDVQGTSYPYLYCVVLARPGFGLAGLASGDAATTEEFARQDDVELIVIRQHTTKTSGYHTPPPRQREIFERALARARIAIDRARTAGGAAA